MKLFLDRITGDEIGSDAFKMTTLREETLIELDGKSVKKGGDNFVLEGANPSAEEEAEALDDVSVETVIDIVDTHRLQAQPIDKKSYMLLIKQYMKSVVAEMEKDETQKERIPIFKKNAAEAVKEFLKNFSDYDTYVGENYNDDGMIILCGYREDGVTPYFIYFADGLKYEKL